VVKLKKQGDLFDDLKETFNNLCKYKMMFNPKKMYFWCIIRKTARLYGIVLGNQYEPEEGGGHRIIASTSDQKRNLEASRRDGSSQSIDI
jgi:hypothetical protein